jgi:ABC-type multidrug transport system ATPase subunit
VQRGEIVALVGPNGAGKTTTDPHDPRHPGADIRRSIREWASGSGGGVLWTSHDMYEVEAVCDRLLFLSHGRILLEGHPRSLPAQHGKASLEELFIAVAREPLAAAAGH